MKKLAALTLLFVASLYCVPKEVEMDDTQPQHEQNEVERLKEKEQHLRSEIKKLRAIAKNTKKINRRLQQLEEQLGEVVGTLRMLRRM